MQIRYHYLIDWQQEKIFPAEISIQDGRIHAVRETDKPCSAYILPGLIDSHVHIESSMLIPSAFARLAVKHGTVATVSDPHEIANVCGLEGIEFMLRNASSQAFKFFFGAPSCAPATSFETAGAYLGPEEVAGLLSRKDIYYLSEMMNYPGVLHQDPQVLEKIAWAKHYQKPVDGHAPGLRGTEARKYYEAGIQTDHECVTYEEAREKLLLGMKILIREGSAAKNFEALIDLLPDFPDQMMFCCDDKHPDELLLHHINQHVKRGLSRGISLYTLIKAACVNPVLHYKLPVGLLRENDPADFIVIDNPDSFNILETVIDGAPVYSDGEVMLPVVQIDPINRFGSVHTQIADLSVIAPEFESEMQVIEAHDTQLLTSSIWIKPKILDGKVMSNPDMDVLKIVVVNRYQQNKPSVAFIRGFGLKRGAIGGTIAHDSHNMIVVGLDDESILRVIQELCRVKGGITVYDSSELHTLALPVGGLMSDQDGEEVAAQYSRLDALTKQLGSELSAPFMTLSFMALLVIPQLKLSDLGLFDGQQFMFTQLFRTRTISG